MLSVVSQTHKDFEYIVIDGNSTDGSKDILTQFKDSISYSASEPDSGVYNAMNKGIKVSKGDYLLFLNSGDVFDRNDVLENVSKELNSKCGIYYGNLIFKNNNSKRLEVYPDKLSFRFFYEKSLPHPASFIKRDLFDVISCYNEHLKIVSDWEFFMIAICKYNVSYKHLDTTISVFETGGMSSLIENRKVIEDERSNVLNQHFPLFEDDLKKIKLIEKERENNRIKMVLELEESKTAQKLNSLWLRVLLKLFRNKNVKDL